MSDTDSDEGVNAETASRLHRGVPIESGEFVLEYNKDSEGYYYLTKKETGLNRKGESEMIVKCRAHFKRVERPGNDMFNLAELDQKTGLYITINRGHETLYNMLVTLSRVTPDEAERQA